MIEVVTIETPSLGNRAYLAHDGRVAVVVDPPRDIDRVLDVAVAAGVRVTHIVETHLHNDYVSGGLDLSRSSGASYVTAASDNVGFDREPVSDGDEVAVGSMMLRVVATPGHTRGHVSYVLDHRGAIHAVFSGGSLLHGTVGRTDLIDPALTEWLTRQQYRSARQLAARLADDVPLYPTHGFGSFCASSQTPASSAGTIGEERTRNPALTVGDEDAFVERLLAGLTAYPRYYAHMAPINRAGPPPLDLSPPEPVDASEVRRRIRDGEWVVDLRRRRFFAEGHLEGTLGVELATPFASYLGWLVPWGMPVTLLGETPEQVAEAQRSLARIGIDRPAGAAIGAPAGWGELRSYPVTDFKGLAAEHGRKDLVVLDVRRDDEWAQGHVSGAVHVPLHDLDGRLGDLPDGELWVHCAIGYRAAIAASLLDRAGRDVVLVDDKWDSAQPAGLPLVPG